MLIIAVALTAVVDLRRLSTPRGIALAYTQALVFGDCEGYLHFSVDGPGHVEPSRTTVCRALLASSLAARNETRTVGLRLLGAKQQGRSATAQVEVTRPGSVQRVSLDLRRAGSQWRVVRDATSCAVLACP